MRLSGAALLKLTLTAFCGFFESARAWPPLAGRPRRPHGQLPHQPKGPILNEGRVGQRHSRRSTCLRSHRPSCSGRAPGRLACIVAKLVRASELVISLASTAAATQMRWTGARTRTCLRFSRAASNANERPAKRANSEIPLTKEQYLSRIQQVIETLEAERAHVQKHLTWLEQRSEERRV